jgi:hypothetical protein
MSCVKDTEEGLFGVGGFEVICVISQQNGGRGKEQSVPASIIEHEPRRHLVTEQCRKPL